MNTLFRSLKAEEVEVRVDTVCEQYATLLLYKNARVDMAILDETVGPLNWQRSHSRDNANCVISIWDESKKQWVSKEDTGSAMTFAGDKNGSKAIASDALKRCGTCWGIGRELYSLPEIRVSASDCKIERDGSGLICGDQFLVTGLTSTDGVITDLEIVNTSKYGRPVVFALGRYLTKEGSPVAEKAEKAPVKPVEAVPAYSVPAAPAPVATAPAIPASVPATGPTEFEQKLAAARNTASPIRSHKGATFGAIMNEDAKAARGALIWIVGSSLDAKYREAAKLLLSYYYKYNPDDTAK